jgi:hypothetical protein
VLRVDREVPADVRETISAAVEAYKFEVVDVS